MHMNPSFFVCPTKSLTINRIKHSFLYYFYANKKSKLYWFLSLLLKKKEKIIFFNSFSQKSNVNYIV